jgi:hypothetical protein
MPGPEAPADADAVATGAGLGEWLVGAPAALSGVAAGPADEGTGGAAWRSGAPQAGSTVRKARVAASAPTPGPGLDTAVPRAAAPGPVPGVVVLGTEADSRRVRRHFAWRYAFTAGKPICRFECLY